MSKFNSYETKSIALEVKDLDIQTRRVKVMLSKFDNVDSDGDVIRRGAFAKSIQERGADSTSNRKIAFLRYHDWEHQIGVFKQLEETHEGLVAVGELGRSTKGTDAFLDYQDGIIREHSIGFNFIPDKINLIGTGDNVVREATEVFLWEGSAVTFGANELTPTMDVGKGNRTEYLEKLNKEMDSLVTALRTGKGTDERLFNFEMRLKVLQQKYNSLISNEPSLDTQDDEPNDSASNKNNFKSFYLNQI